jgi:hypothetical protein
MATPPSPSVLTSGLIKAIRLRHADLAISYLGYLWNSGKDIRARVRRRILICSAEDNTYIDVMARVSDWFNKGGPEVKDAVREMLRINGTPNWYATACGRAYIRAWWQAERSPDPPAGQDQGVLLATIEEDVQSGSTLSALQAFNATISLRGYNRQSLVDRLHGLALERNNGSAARLSNLYQKNMKALWWDANLTGQCLYTLLVGPIGPQADPKPDERQVAAFAAQADAQKSAPEVPSWCLDGIHVPGNDPRFSGSIKHMAAACAAFERFGRLSPDDVWTSETILMEDRSRGKIDA